MWFMYSLITVPYSSMGPASPHSRVDFYARQRVLHLALLPGEPCSFSEPLPGCSSLRCWGPGVCSLFFFFFKKKQFLNGRWKKDVGGEAQKYSREREMPVGLCVVTHRHLLSDSPVRVLCLAAAGAGATTRQLLGDVCPSVQQQGGLQC